jgi:hypothetical protein
MKILFLIVVASIVCCNKKLQSTKLLECTHINNSVFDCRYVACGVCHFEKNKLIIPDTIKWVEK